MKRICFIVLVTTLAAVLFTQCTKRDDPNAMFNASFFTTKSNGRMSLYVDDTYKGDLPYFATAPACGAMNGDGQTPLSLQMRSGQYQVVGKDTAGRVVSSTTIYFSTSKTSASGGIGGGSIFNNGECVVIGLFE